MECKVYGHRGRPVLFIPCQDGRFYDFENYRMADVWRPWIDGGEVMVFAIDTIDKESWKAEIESIEAFYNKIGKYPAEMQKQIDILKKNILG